MKKYETIILEKRGNIATITLNRPEKLNTENAKLAEELIDVFDVVDRDDDVKVVVITGAGRAFCAGADLKERFLQRVEDKKKGIVVDVTREFSEVGCMALTKVKKPVIASINGAAIGFGCTLALACDIRIASENARFSLPFARVGLIPEFGATYFLPRLIGMGKACELVFTARMIDAKEAKEIGLVNQVVPHDKLSQATYEMAESITKLAPLAIQLSKRALYQGMSATDLASQLQYEAFPLNYLFGTEDLEEGARAFLEKREPIFRGK